MPPDPTAAEVVARLGLAPHPEGGRFRETFRDPAPPGRGASTAIYYLLEGGYVSAWHRVVDAAEVWHAYAGAPLELAISRDGGDPELHVLGSDLGAGQEPQAVVPAGAWQRARSLGSWSLMGCTVAPAFEFASFELAPEGWEPGG